MTVTERPSRGARFRGLVRGFWAKLTWGDRLLMLAVLVGCAGFIPWLRSGAPGQAAVVRLENRVIAELPLQEERELTVTGPLGETVIQVKDGRVRVLRDPGPLQLCVRQGWISRAGEALICLPNRITIQIPGPGPPAYDALVR